uniref:Putative ovule protein n=1 Tax=Solanum chacoense TaxID=4108 RepID=A0A0V0GFJ2_SOLCH
MCEPLVDLRGCQHCPSCFSLKLAYIDASCIGRRVREYYADCPFFSSLMPYDDLWSLRLCAGA